MRLDLKDVIIKKNVPYEIKFYQIMNLRRQNTIKSSTYSIDNITKICRLHKIIYLQLFAHFRIQ